MEERGDGQSGPSIKGEGDRQKMEVSNIFNAAKLDDVPLGRYDTHRV